MTHISVITPVYNAESTLARCLDSILSQTFPPYELIVIDDGCTDSSSTILKQYAGKHDFISIVTQVNQGVSAARNAGINVSKGDWIMFVDADDYLAPTTLETLAANISGELSLAGLTICTAQKIYEQNLFQNNVEKGTYGVMNISAALSSLSYYTFCGPVCKLFRADIIKNNHIRFPLDMRFGEDTVFVYTYLKYVKQVIVNNTHPYFCDKSNDSSLTSTINSTIYYYSYRRIYPAMRDVYQTNNLPLEYTDYIYLDALQTATHLSYKDYGLSSKERIQIYKSMIANENFKCIQSQCSLIFRILGRLRAWHLCELYLKIRNKYQ